MPKRALSVADIYKMKFDDMNFTGKWNASFGNPERSGVWLLWGNSGNGKTSFSLQMAKYLTQFGRVAYNTMEEGASKSFRMALQRENMHHATNFIVINEDIEDLYDRLQKRKSPNIIINDSYQYLGLTKKEYKQLKADFPEKLFIFISHAEGKQPEGSAAKFVRYDADVKIWVEGYKAFFTSRFGGQQPFVIWEEGAQEYWAEIN